MKYDNKYGGVVWTNHALQRLKERGIPQGDAWAAWKRPDQSRYAATRGAWVYYKTWGTQRIEVVAKQDERKQWIIMSVWSRPTHEKKREGKKTSLLKKIIKKLMGK